MDWSLIIYLLKKICLLWEFIFENFVLIFNNRMEWWEKILLYFRIGLYNVDFF